MWSPMFKQTDGSHNDLIANSVPRTDSAIKFVLKKIEIKMNRKRKH